MLPNLTQSIKTVVFPRSASLLGCPGLYCGRTALPSGLLSECAACPKGHRPTMNSICDPCKDALTPYAWMYLAFMAILPLILQATVIDLIFRKWRKKIYVLLQICAVFEAFSAALTTVILFSGDEYLTIGFCGVDRVTDWYTLFRNPQPDYINTLQCTQEAVYPLYSMVFVYYFFSLLYMLSFRGVLLAKWTWSTMSRNALLAGLYQYPLLLAIHACCAGLLYFIFPHIVIIISSISCAIHCAVVPQQTLVGICKGLLASVHSVAVVLIHWICLAFGVFALCHLYTPSSHYLQSLRDFGLISPTILAPLAAYLLTCRLTDPKKYYQHFD